MNSRVSKRKLFAALLVIASRISAVHGQQSPEQVRKVTDKDQARIAAAMPTTLLAPVKQPRRILVYSWSMGYYHQATSLGEAFFKKVEERFQGYSFVMSNDPEDYRLENLKRFDAIVVNNGTQIQRRITDPDIQKGILQFVEEGGGCMGIHAAADGGWMELSDMLGTRFNGHPWGASETHAFLNEAPSGSMTKHLGEEGFRVKDEIYVSSDPFFSRDKVCVLISMDLSDPETAAKPVGNVVRADRDYSVSHVRRYGRGRVFYTSFGHTDNVYMDTRILTHYLAGLQYVAGDLAVDDAPLPLYDRLKAHSGPLNFEATLKLMRMARNADNPMKQEEVVALCTKLIRDGSATDESKQVAIEALSFVATPDSIQTVAEALGNVALTHAALVFLSRHADDVAFHRICNQAWGELPDPARINLINAMAARGPVFADALLGVAETGSEPLREAAVKALGHCGTEDQLPGLAVLRGGEALTQVRDAAVLQIAGQVPSEEAYPVYKQLLAESKSVPVRRAALLAMARTNPAQGEVLILRYLAGSDEEMTQAAIAASEFVPGQEMTRELAALISDAPPEDAPVLIHALAARKDPLVPALLEQRLPQSVARLEVIKVLGEVGTAAQVPALVAVLGGEVEPAADAAMEALARLRSPGVDEALVAQFNQVPADIHPDLLKICGARQTAILAPAALKFITSEDRKTAAGALKAVALCGTEAEFTALCDFALADPKHSGVRNALGKLGSRLHNDELVAKVLITYAERATPGQQVVFLELLGGFQTPEAAQYLGGQVGGASAEVEYVAVKTLSNWNDGTPVRWLRRACETGQTEKSRDLAFAGVARLMTKDDQLPPNAKLDAFESLLNLARTDPQLIAVLDGLSSVAHPGVVDVAESYLRHANGQVSAAAKTAISNSYHGLRRANWSLRSNFNNQPDELKRMIDLDPATRWATLEVMAESGAMWLIVDLGYEQKVRTVTMDTTDSPGDFPPRYELYVSETPDASGTPVATGDGATVTEMACDALGRYVKIVQKGTKGLYWSIHELRINGLPQQAQSGEPLAADSYELSTSVHTEAAANMIDGSLGSGWRPAGNQKAGQSIVVDLGGSFPVSMVTLDRSDKEAYPGLLQVYSSNDPNDWGDPIAVVEGSREETRTVADFYPFGERYLKIEVAGDANHPWEVRELELYGQPKASR